VAVEATSTEILGFLGSSVIRMLHWEASVWGKIGRHVHGVGIEARLGRDEGGRRVLEFYSCGVVEFLVGLVGR